MKKWIFGILFAVMAALCVVLVAYAASFTTCQTVYNEMNGNEKEATICHTVTVNWIHNPDRVACKTDGTRSIQLFNGYTAKLSTLYCNPKTYTTGSATSKSLVYIYKDGYGTDFSSIKCTYKAWIPGAKSCSFGQAR